MLTIVNFKSTKSMAALKQLIAVLLCSFFYVSPPAAACNSRDEAALLKIKAAFANPNIFSSWNSSTDCCHWAGVSCNTPIGNRIATLSFYNRGGPLDGLHGPLPDALGDLPYLNFLLLGNNPLLNGHPPLALTRLRYLSFLSLHSNSLSGPIPTFLSQLHSLRSLDLSFNKFSGFIPPELSTLPNLNGLYLSGNFLVGGIPAAFGSFSKTSPPSLNLSHNRLSGEISPEFGVPNWVTLDLSHNELSGAANIFLGTNKTVRSLDLSFNKFGFDLSQVSFQVNLTTLLLNDNMITGSIPDKINQLKDLAKFNVRNNRLCDLIPVGPVMDKFDDTHFFPNRCLCRAKFDFCA